MWHDLLVGSFGRVVWLGILALTAVPYTVEWEKWVVSLWEML